MPVNQTPRCPDASELPYLMRIFDELRRGKHLAEGDGPHVHALREQVESYVRLFDALGFSLVQHSRGFFYFAGDASGNVTEQAGRMAVFTFILVESLADQGKQVEETLMTLIGAPTFIAWFMSLQIFTACASASDPPNTVKSCA